jgi:hypothetical protein
MRASSWCALASVSVLSLALASCGGDDREGAPAPIEPLSETSSALTFRSNPYDYDLAPPAGSSYTDLVPKTLDLADMAALTLQTMTLNVDPAANYKFWFIADWSVNPPHLRHESEFWATDDFQGDIASQGKFLAPLVWNRLVSGSSFNMINHRHIIDQLFLDVNKTLAMQGSGVRAYEGFIVNYLRDGNAMWKTFVLQAVQDWVQSLVESGDQGEEAYWGDSPPGKDIDRQDPWREEVMLLAYKYLGYAPALAAARKHINYVRRSSGMFAENGSFDDTHDNGPHFHIHALHLQAFLNMALAVQDQDLLDFVNRSYLWAQRRDIGSISLIGYFPELVRVEQNGEGCSLADMVTLAIDLSKTGQFDYWDDADRWVRNHFAEAQLTTPTGNQLQAYAQRLPYDPGSVEPTDYAGPQVTARSIGGFAGWPTPNDFRQEQQRGIQQCCTGNGSRAVFHVWDNIVTDEGGIFRVNLLLNRASPRADVYSYIPYVGKVEVKMKQATPDVRIRIPGWVSNSGLALAVNGTSRAFGWDGRYMKVGSVAAGDRITVTLMLSESTARESMYGTQYTFTKRGSTIVGVTPRGTFAPLYDRASMRSSPAPMVSVKRFLSNEADITNRRDPTWKLPVVAVTASSSEPGFPPELMLDGSQDEASRWDSRGDGQFAVFDLGRPYAVKYVAAAFYQGDERVARFEVQVSPDGRRYTPVFNGQSGSQTNKLTGFNCEAAPPARYVKVIGHGNSQSEFNEITELEIFGNTADAPADLAAQVSATAQDGSNGPARARDNNLNTRWSAGETESIKLDLGAHKSVVSGEIAFYLATSRTYHFDVETSPDDEHWTLVWTGNSARSTLQLQPFDIPNIAARYVRITGQGSSVDGSIGITEIKVRGF